MTKDEKVKLVAEIAMQMIPMLQARNYGEIDMKLEDGSYIPNDELLEQATNYAMLLVVSAAEAVDIYAKGGQEALRDLRTEMIEPGDL